MGLTDEQLTLILFGLGLVVSMGVAIVSHRKQTATLRRLSQIVTTYPRSEEFVEATASIHRSFSRVSVLAHSSGLLLPTERDAEPTRARQGYFGLIHRRLIDGSGYRLKYLADLSEYESAIAGYFGRPEEERNRLIADSRAMLAAVCARTLWDGNLDLRVARLDPGTPSMVIGGDSIAGLGYRDATERHNTQWVVVREHSLVGVIRFQFDHLFQNASKVTPDLLEATLANIGVQEEDEKREALLAEECAKPNGSAHIG